MIGAVTVSPLSAPFQGTWHYGGVEFVDDINRFEIITEHPYIEGFVILEVFFAPLPTSPPVDPLDVAAIYTYRAEPAGTNAVAIDVTVFPAKSNRYTIPLIIAVPADGTVSPASGRGKQLQKE